MSDNTERIAEREQLVRLWFSAWLDRDGSQISTIFAENAVYTECYGPQYRGRAQIEHWFADWNARGRVLEWTIKRFLHDGASLAVEWYFACDYDGVAGFDGVTLVDFDADGRVSRLCEFQSKSEHEYPYDR